MKKMYKVYGYDVIVEDGKVFGIETTDYNGNYTIKYPYSTNNRGNGMLREDNLTIPALRARIKRGTVKFF